MNVASSQIPAGGSLPDITMEMAELEIVPGETARFPFMAYTERDLPSIHDFGVSSDNPNFNPAWAHIVRSTDSDTLVTRYTLEVQPTNIRRSQYGTYPLHLYWGQPGTARCAEGRCTLTIRPCARLTVKPSLQVWPTGTLSFSLENCGTTGIDVSVSISHHGSNWSKGWEFELQAGEGPFEFSGKFDPPSGARGGEFELDISVEDISLIRMQVRARHLISPRKLIITTAIVLTGGAIGATLAAGGVASTSLVSQAITFTSTPPATPAPGDTYRVAAKGGASGNPVILTIDSMSTSICSISGFTVTFNRPGNCMIDANQAGNKKYRPAPQAHQTIIIGSAAKQSQSISFTLPATASMKTSATLSATGGGSGNPIVFSVDPTSDPGVCTVSGANGTLVFFNRPGSCVIDANQAGNDTYAAALQVQRTISVAKAAQSISFTPPATGLSGGSATLAAKGGGSSNPVVFTVDPTSDPGVCTVSGLNGTTVNYTAVGSCVIDANQAGNDTYAAAPTVQGTITVNDGTSVE